MDFRDKIRLPPNLRDGGNLRDGEAVNESISSFQYFAKFLTINKKCAKSSKAFKKVDASISVKLLEV